MILKIFSIFTALIAANTLNISDISQNFRLNNVFEDDDPCFQETRLFSEKDSENYEIFKKTGECAKHFENLKDSQNEPEDFEKCPPGLLDVHITPSYVAKSQISYPYANLNISAVLHSSVSHIFIRFECLHAEDGSDVYCSNHPSMIINGRHEWPCRGIKLANSLSTPIHFGYSCFRLTAYSIYAINVTVWPQKCVSTLIISSPSLHSLFPEQTDRSSNWSPMMIADLSDADGVWIRVGKPNECSNYPGETVRAHIYRQSSNQSLTFVESLDIVCPATGVKWSNVIRGHYLIIAHVVSLKCQFQCERSNCVECNRTNLNFTLPEDRTSATWRAARKVRDSSDKILLFLSATCVILVILAIFYVKYLKRAQKMGTEIELINRVKVLLIYANDCEEHNLCISSLVDCLRFEANSDVLYDVEELREPGSIPSRWLIDSFCGADKHLIVLSPCGLRILELANSPKRLVQDRPFPDVFGPAIELVIRKSAFSPQEARKKFAIVRLDYSPPIPENLRILGLKSFEIPGQFAEMTAFLHNLGDGEQKFVVRQNLDQNLKENVARMKKMMSENEGWIEGRFEDTEESLDQVDLRMVQDNREAIRTDEERRNAAERLNLLPPDSEEDLRPSPKQNATPFMLYGPSDSDSDEN